MKKDQGITMPTEKEEKKQLHEKIKISRYQKIVLFRMSEVKDSGFLSIQELRVNPQFTDFTIAENDFKNLTSSITYLVGFGLVDVIKTWRTIQEQEQEQEKVCVKINKFKISQFGLLFLDWGYLKSILESMEPVLFAIGDSIESLIKTINHEQT